VILLVKLLLWTGVQEVTRMLLEKRSGEDPGTRSVFASLRSVAAEAYALGALNEQ
jgi:hypothetical protein